MAIKKNKPSAEIVETKEEIVEEVKEENVPAKKEKKKIYVVKTVLNFRKEPSKNAMVIKVLNKDDEIEVAKIENDWAECYSNKVKGYVMAQYIILK